VIEPSDVDSDGDGVLDGDDLCPGTVIPEAGVPTEELGTNRWALVDDDFEFDTTKPEGKGPKLSFNTTDTAGCSCEQIIEILDLGEGHTKFGCSISAMRDWLEIVGNTSGSAFAEGRGCGSGCEGEPVFEEAPDTGAGVTVVVLGTGDVTSSRPVIDGVTHLGMVCSGGACRANFADGSVAVLYARPHPGRSEFVGWGGDCRGSDPIALVTAGSNVVCTATFQEIDPE